MSDGGLLLVLGASFVVGLSGAAAPGPLLAFTIREAAQRGWGAGPSIATGHSALELLVVAALAMGLGPYLEVQGVASAIGLGGGGFLLWLAWGIGRHPRRGAPSLVAPVQGGGGSPRRPVIGGVLVSLSNPFWLVWWLTAGAALLGRSYQMGLVGVGVFYVGHILADYFWYGLVALGVASGRRVMTPTVYGGIMLACAGFLAAMGVYFIATGLRPLA